MMNESPSVSSLLKETRKTKHYRDVELLLCHVLKQNRAHLYSHGESTLNNTQARHFHSLFARLNNNEPIAYLLQHKEFYGLDLKVNKNVLIPRPETELLVEYALQQICAGSTVLDLGTGSGAIALALAAQLSPQKKCKIVASDICTRALKLARQNAQTHQVKVEFVHSDWFDSISDKFDLILCNPPYIAESDPQVQASVLEHEPHKALFSKNDGLCDIERIITDATGHLKKNASIAIEHGWQQAAAVTQLFQQAHYTGITTLKDLAGLPRITLANYAQA